MPALHLSALDRAQTVAAKGMLALPPRVQLLAGGGVVRLDGLELHPQMQLFRFLAAANGFCLRDDDHLVARERYAHDLAAFGSTPTSIAWSRELQVAGAEGPLRARLYVPHGYRAPGALLVYLHGGGWVLGDVDSYEAPCRFIAAHSGAALLSVDYRLAPEHPFPSPVDDAIAAFADVIGRAQELGADSERIGVGGDSAGGHLSAVVALQAARDGGPAPAFQLLIYPVVDNADPWPSYEACAESFLLERADMDWFRSHFIPPDADRRDPRLSPFQAEDLSGVAPAYIVTAGFDPLRDEGEAYAARLREAGVPVTLRRQRAMMHGFIGVTAISSAAARATAEIAGALQVGLALR